jgi:hypothetical protein
MDVETFVDRWQRPCTGMPGGSSGNDADAADLTQEILLTLHRRRDRYDPTRPFELLDVADRHERRVPTPSATARASRRPARCAR